MLRRLKLGNFKSWQEADLAFGRITGLFGTNSSGKSSLIQALLLLKQTRESADRAAALELNGWFVELGTAADVVHAHDEGRAIELEVGFEHDSDLRIDGPSDRRGTAIADSKGRAVRGRLAISSQALGSRSLTHSAGAAEFSLKPRGGNGDGFDLAASVPDLDFSFIRNRGRACDGEIIAAPTPTPTRPRPAPCIDRDDRSRRGRAAPARRAGGRRALRGAGRRERAVDPAAPRRRGGARHDRPGAGPGRGRAPTADGARALADDALAALAEAGELIAFDRHSPRSSPSALRADYFAHEVEATWQAP